MKILEWSRGILAWSDLGGFWPGVIFRNFGLECFSGILAWSDIRFGRGVILGDIGLEWSRVI